jgi:hypothetical protein
LSRPFYKIRYKWLGRIKLDQLELELRERYSVRMKVMPRDDLSISVFDEQNVELMVKADTLYAYAGMLKVILFQKEAWPFTEHDKTLKDRMFEIYPWNKASPLF